MPERPPAPASQPDAAVVLTVDVGTSSVRCCAFDAQGRQLPHLLAAHEYEPTATPDGGSELEPGPLLERTLDCLGRVAAAAADEGRPILAVGLCTFWHAFLGLDAQGQPLTPIYLWNDMRAAGAAAALKARLEPADVHRRTGCVLHPSYLPARLTWLAGSDPARHAACARFVSFGEYLEQCLFGSPRCSLSMASGTGLFNQERLDWDAEVLAVLGLAPERLSPLERAHAPRRGLAGPLANRLVPLRDVPFFPALGDGACSNVGSGATQPAEAALMIGTSAAMRLFFAEGAPAPPKGLWRYLLDGRRGLVGGAISNGGNLFAWLTHTLRLPPLEALEAELEAMAPAEHGLAVLPFLAGERNPDFPLDARGMVAGLRTATTPVQIVQAGMEAVAFRLAAIADRLRALEPGLHRYVASGGLLRSRAWLRILADVLGLPVVLSTVQEASSRGVALMALEALGLLPSAAEAPPALGETIVPDPARHERYRAARAEHERLYALHVRSSVD